mgnify:CR=1 FL=1
MIEKLSIGIDIVDINRFKKLDYKKNSKFYKKIFAESKIGCFENILSHKKLFS